SVVVAHTRDLCQRDKFETPGQAIVRQASVSLSAAERRDPPVPSSAGRQSIGLEAPYYRVLGLRVGRELLERDAPCRGPSRPRENVLLQGQAE
ncbi:unnamed protein product, partial [Ectocarpus fasciculatus]